MIASYDDSCELIVPDLLNRCGTCKKAKQSSLYSCRDNEMGLLSFCCY